MPDIGENILKRVKHLAPVTYIVPISGTLAIALETYAQKEEVPAEIIIAEAIRAYMGDDR